MKIYTFVGVEIPSPVNIESVVRQLKPSKTIHGVMPILYGENT